MHIYMHKSELGGAVMVCLLLFPLALFPSHVRNLHRFELLCFLDDSTVLAAQSTQYVVAEGPLDPQVATDLLSDPDERVPVQYRDAL